MFTETFHPELALAPGVWGNETVFFACQEHTHVYSHLHDTFTVVLKTKWAHKEEYDMNVRVGNEWESWTLEEFTTYVTLEQLYVEEIKHVD